MQRRPARLASSERTGRTGTAATEPRAELLEHALLLCLPVGERALLKQAVEVSLRGPPGLVDRRYYVLLAHEAEKTVNIRVCECVPGRERAPCVQVRDAGAEGGGVDVRLGK
jgi:hypothetical protein